MSIVVLVFLKRADIYQLLKMGRFLAYPVDPVQAVPVISMQQCVTCTNSTSEQNLRYWQM